MQATTVEYFCKQQARRSIFVALCLSFLATSALADPPYGVYYNENVGLDLSAGRFSSPQVNDHRNVVLPGGIAQQGELVLPTQQSTQTSVGPLGQGTAQVTGTYFSAGSITGPALHASVEAMAPSDRTCAGQDCTFSAARAHVYELWTDHIFVTAPVGVATVQLLVSPYFEGTYFASRDYVPDGVGAPVGPTDANFFFDFQNNPLGFAYEGSFTHVFSGPETFRDQTSRVLNVIPNPSLPILVELQLIVDAYAGVPYGPDWSFVNALNTGSVTIEVLTPGASIQSASGYSYAAVAAVPEASSLALLLTGLGAISGYAARRRTSRN